MWEKLVRHEKHIPNFTLVISVHLIGFIPTKDFSLNHIHMLTNITCDIFFPNSFFHQGTRKIIDGQAVAHLVGHKTRS